MLSAYDLDGVLLDTRQANLEAYRFVGIEPPPDFHVSGWEKWTTKEAHGRKNHVLPRFLEEYARPLPLLSLALAQGAPVLSSASESAIRSLEKLFLDLRYLKISHSLRVRTKLMVIRSLGTSGVYYDDSKMMCDIVAKETSWQACHVRARSTG